MRMLLAEKSFGRSAGGIVVERNPWLLQRKDDIRLRHAEDRDSGQRVVFDQEIEERVHRIFVPNLGDFGKALALQRKQLRVLTTPIMTASGPGISCHSLSQSSRE